jgi:hypothetical protein
LCGAGTGRRYKRRIGLTGDSGKPYAPPVSGTDPRSAREGAMLGRPVNAAAAGFFFVWFFLVFMFYFFFLVFCLFFFLKIFEHF